MTERSVSNDRLLIKIAADQERPFLVSPVLNLSSESKLLLHITSSLSLLPPILVSFSNVEETNLTQDDKTDK